MMNVSESLGVAPTIWSIGADTASKVFTAVTAYPREAPSALAREYGRDENEILEAIRWEGDYQRAA